MSWETVVIFSPLRFARTPPEPVPSVLGRRAPGFNRLRATGFRRLRAFGFNRLSCCERTTGRTFPALRSAYVYVALARMRAYRAAWRGPALTSAPPHHLPRERPPGSSPIWARLPLSDVRL